MDRPTFSTDHLYLCAFLLCSGHPLVATSDVGRRVGFEFADTPELNADVARFMADAAIPARRFSFELLKLKRLIHQGEKRVKKIEPEEEAGCENPVKIRRR